MPRGEHPNSRKNLKAGNKKTQFTVDNAVEMQERSTQAKSWAKHLSGEIEARMEPGEAAEILLKMYRRGNLRAGDMLLDITGAKAAKKVEVSQPISEVQISVREYIDAKTKSGS